jgi:hypothetical protein
MRFILLARERTTGVVRLLSERAFESQSAAVDAATVTAHSIDLRDDEVFAVDLDQAGPVLVLRIEVPSREAPAQPQPTAARPWSWMTSTTPEVPGVATPEASDEPSPTREEAHEVFASEIVLRLQPRYPLFAEEEREAEPQTPGVGLRAPTSDRYTPEDESDLLDAREESRLLADAADLLFDTAAIQRSEAIDFHMSNDDALRASDGDVLPVSEADVIPVPEADIASVSEADTIPVSGSDAIPVSMGDAVPISEEDVWPDSPPVADELVEALLVEEIDIEYDLALDAPEQDIPEETADAELIVGDNLAFEERPPEEDLPQEAPAAAVGIFAEPEPYRAPNTNFAVWVCADCVYQRTCRKAGIATPASCGNFQWRSF